MRKKVLLVVAALMIAVAVLTGCAKSYPYELDDLSAYADVVGEDALTSMTGYALENDETALVFAHESEESSVYSVVVFDKDKIAVNAYSCEAKNAKAALDAAEDHANTDKTSGFVYVSKDAEVLETLSNGIDAMLDEYTELAKHAPLSKESYLDYSTLRRSMNSMIEKLNEGNTDWDDASPIYVSPEFYYEPKASFRINVYQFWVIPNRTVYFEWQDDGSCKATDILIGTY